MSHAIYPAITSYLNYYGDGGDGNVTLAINTTLTRSMYYNNLTINNGIVLSPDGFKIHVKGRLINNGTIRRNGIVGDPGVLANAGNGGAAISSLARDVGGNFVGGNGGVGGVTSGAQGQVVAANLVIRGGGAGGLGGVGGTGVVPFFGGASGTTTDGRFTKYLVPAPNIIGGQNAAGALFSVVYGGGGAAGGGGGGGDTTNSGGGGGGGGSSGGVIGIWAKELLNNGVMEVLGGGGGAGGTNPGAGNVGGGAGGGGAGGGLYLFYDTFVTIGTLSVTGGVGGVGGAGFGTGTAGANGANGSVGTVARYNNLIGQFV